MSRLSSLRFRFAVARLHRRYTAGVRAELAEYRTPAERAEIAEFFRRYDTELPPLG